MELKRFNIELDIKKRNFNELFQVVQGDYDTNVLEIQLFNDTQKYDLTDLTVEIAFRKADGTTVIQTESSGVSIISAFDGKIECTLKTNTIAAIGTVVAEVRVLGTDNKLLTSTTFEFLVREAIVNDGTIESTNEFPVLLEMIDTVNTLINEVSQIEQQVPENILQNMGDLSTLTTDDKSSLVNAINEVNADVANLDLSTINQRFDIIDTDINNLEASITQINTNVGNLESSISTINTDITTLENTVDSISTELENKVIDFTGVLDTSWAGTSAPYTKTVTVTGISSTGKPPVIDITLSSTWSTALIEEQEWAKIKRIEYSNNTLTFYADEIPTIALNFKGLQIN